VPQISGWKIETPSTFYPAVLRLVYPTLIIKDSLCAVHED